MYKCCVHTNFIRNIFVSLLFVFPLLTKAEGTVPHLSLNKIHELVVQEQFDKAIYEYSRYIQNKLSIGSRTKGVEFNVMAEYAYVLALNGMYDGALTNLDRAIALGREDKKTKMDKIKAEKLLRFYICQVYQLMSYPDIASTFTKNEILQPDWLTKQQSDAFIQKYKTFPVVNQDGFSAAVTRANTLAAQGQYFLSLTIFQELIENFPNEATPYMGQSKVWETLGYYDKAAELLTEGMSRSKIQETARQPIENHLNTLRKKKAETTMPPFGSSLAEADILYIGGMFSSDYWSFNGRWGRTNYRKTGSIDLGLTHMANTTYFSFGFSNYVKVSIVSAGYGISYNFQKGDPSYTIKLSAGLSVLSRGGKGTFDWMYAFSLTNHFKQNGENAVVPMLGVSLGFSNYFAKREKK